MPYIESQTDELASAMQEMIQLFGTAKAEEILRGYQEMAADDQRETEALGWIESYVGECL